MGIIQYRVVANGTLFDVHLSLLDRRKRVIEGFASAAEAEAWGVQILRLFLENNPHEVSFKNARSLK